MDGTLRITKIEFKAGSTSNQSPLIVTPKAVTILVGPNNSGKSLALMEIETRCKQPTEVIPEDIIKNIEIDYIDKLEEAEKLLSTVSVQNRTPAEFRIPDFRFDQNSSIGRNMADIGPIIRNVQQEQLLISVRDKIDYPKQFQTLTPFFTFHFRVGERLLLALPQPVSNWRDIPTHHLHALFLDDAARKRWRDIVNRALGLYPVIDPTGILSFIVRLSKREPSIASEEQGLDLAARTFHDEAKYLTSFGSGIQAFEGLLAGVLSKTFKISLIDEPEAFLHPPMARFLGRELTKIAVERDDCSLVVATHSSDFLMGCLEQAPEKITIVRLTYVMKNDVATARELSSQSLAEAIRDPLLRSTELFKALFYEAVIVTEGHSDRVVYEEINQRLLASDPKRGINDAQFISTHGIVSIPDVVKYLRKMGILAIAVVDLDVIIVNPGDKHWTELLDCCRIPKVKRQALEATRAYLYKCFTTKYSSQTTKELRLTIKQQGINGLDPSDKKTAEDFLKELSEYGLFLVPVGEVESWLAYLGLSRQKAEWVQRLVSHIITMEANGQPFVPTNDDIWQFINEIADWVNNPNRLGFT
jgi:hypothetical protein